MKPERSLWYSGAFWRAQPAAARIRLLTGVFLTFSAIGYVVDVWSLDPERPIWLVARGAVYLGLLAVGYAYAMLRGGRRLVLLMVVLQFLTFPLAPVARIHGRAPGPALIESARIYPRLVFDGIATLVSIAAAYFAFMSFIRRDGARHIRLRTEIDLARRLHERIAPPIDARAGGLQFYGRSEASYEISGDLVDLVVAEGRSVAYVADVTGHGIAAGSVAGMVKSALRMGLLESAPLEKVLQDLNRVLLKFEQRELFVTCAAVAFGRDGVARAALAGHPPALVVPAGDEAVRQVSSRNPPLGVLEGHTFEADAVELEVGDLLVLFTDGFTEVRDRNGEEFGIEALQRVLVGHKTRPLSEIAQVLLREVRAHGPQMDDQTFLLIRALTSPDRSG